MTEPLPATNRCGFRGEWWAQAHVCPSKADYIVRPAGIKIEAKAEPDCRTCRNTITQYGVTRCNSTVVCTDADRYEPLPPVRLWRTT